MSKCPAPAPAPAPVRSVSYTGERDGGEGSYSGTINVNMGGSGIASNVESDLSIYEQNKKLKEEIKELKAKLQEKTEDLKDMEDLNQVLLTKERLANDEVQDVRKALISVLFKVLSHETQTGIGIKIMGEIDPMAFMEECYEKFSEEEYEESAMEMWELWQRKITHPGPNWDPFKIVEIGDNKFKKVIKEDNFELSVLKEEWGEDLYRVVTSALMDMEEYNPSGRYCVPELWNFDEDRKATSKEVVDFIFKEFFDHII